MNTKRNTLKRVIVILSAVLVIFITGFVFLTITLKKRIEQHITHLLPGQQISLSSIQPDLLRSSLSINNLLINLKVDSPLQNHQHTLYFPTVELAGINVFKLITDKKLFINKVRIENGDINMDELLLNNKEFSLANQLTNIPIPFRQLFIKELEIEKANVWLHAKNSNHLLLRGNIAIHELSVNGIDKSFNIDSSHLSSFDCHLYDVNYPLANSNGALQIKNILADSRKSIIRIDSFSIHYLLNNLIPLKKTNHAAIPIHTTISRIELRKPDLTDLIHEKVRADEIVFLDSKIEVSNSDQLFHMSKRKTFLADYLKKIPLEISTGRLTLHQTSFVDDSRINHLRVRGDVTIHQLHIHPVKLSNKEAIDFSALDFSLSDLYSSIPHTLYNVSISILKMNSEKAILSGNQLKIIPQLSKFEFSRRLGYQADRIEAAIPQIVVSHPNLIQLMNHKLFADEVIINGCSASIFRDRRLPRRLKYQPLPVAFLKKLPWDIRINRLKIKNSSASYEEFPIQGQQTGKIAIQNLQLMISPLLNRPTRIDPSQLLLKTEGSIMGSGIVYSTIHLPLYSDKYSVNGAIKNLNLTSLNLSSENLGNIKIKSGLLDSLGFVFDFTDKKATGNIVGVYHNLIIQPLKKDGENGKKKVAKIKSFMLRHFIIPLNKDRTLPVAKRTGKIDYQRDPTRFISYYLMQSLLTGIKSSFTLGFLLPK